MRVSLEWIMCAIVTARGVAALSCHDSSYNCDGSHVAVSTECSSSHDRCLSYSTNYIDPNDGQSCFATRQECSSDNCATVEQNLQQYSLSNWQCSGCFTDNCNSEIVIASSDTPAVAVTVLCVAAVYFFM
mmetsp:Transcript_7777/g.21294  ORF Transcript_7777/g.21294 Transcript_7777/m.21294 type:complete len:130 (-) Transcript_7777:115-504(-)